MKHILHSLLLYSFFSHPNIVSCVMYIISYATASCEMLQIADDIDELQDDGLSEEEISQIVESGRVAEIKWKVRFAALGLAITTIAFFEVNGGVDAVRVLRDSYCMGWVNSAT